MPGSSIARVVGLIRWPTTFAGKIQKANNIQTAVGAAAATFTAPTPTPATVSAAVVLLTTRESAANTHAHGAADSRDAQWRIVRGLYNQLLSYVQVIADQQPDAAASSAIFALAGMDTEADHGHAPRTTKSSQARSTVVDLQGPATPDNTACLWQYGTTAGALTSYMVTIHSKLALENQTPGTILYWRYLVVTVNGYGDWSPTYQHLVT